MANLTLLDPFGVFRGEPFADLLKMQRDMLQLFGQFLESPLAPAAAGKWKPMVETFKKDDNLIVKSELPGVDPGDVDVSFDETTNELVIEGERKRDQEARRADYIQRELSYGKFELRFPMPRGIKINLMKAKYNNGMLEVTVPLALEARPRKIQIEASAGSPEVRKGEKKAA